MDSVERVRGKQLIIAIDHGLSFPEIEGLEQPINTLRELASLPQADGIIATPGMYRQAQRKQIPLQRLQRFITVDCVLADASGWLKERETLISPEDATEYQPDCYKMFFNMYDDSRQLMNNVRDLNRYIVAGARLGVKTLAEIMFYNNQRFAQPGQQAAELYKGCRMAMELGADYLKIPMLEDIDAMGEIIHRVQLPTYILGGPSCHTTEELVASLERLKGLPIEGFMFGRNLWQHGDMTARVERIAGMVH